jgi:transposase
MTRYIGLDAHTESCTVVVLGSSGRRVSQEVLETDAATLKSFIQRFPRPRHLCMEEGNLSEWLYEELEPLVDELVVVMPHKSHGPKSDLRDAEKLANDLRRGNVEQRVYKAPGTFRELREAVRAHCMLQRAMVRTKTQLHALCRARGLSEHASTLYSAESRLEVLPMLPEPVALRAVLLGEQLDAQIQCVQRAEDWLKQAAARVPIVKRIATAPGIGIVRASYIAAIVVSPHRFRTSRQFWSYCGLAIVMRSSSDWVRDGRAWARKKVTHTRGLNQNRHPLLKCVFKGAAVQLTRMPQHPLGQAYQQLLTKAKPNLARLTMARRIAAAVLAMWKNNEDYDPERHQSR